VKSPALQGAPNIKPANVGQHEPYDETGNRQRVARLRERGVDVWGPERVYVAADVPLEGIEPGASILQATLTGADLRIGRGSRIGVSGHARVANCQIGRDVELGAGTFEGATFLDGVTVRGFAEIRPGTLLEEQVDAAHSVAFKNTILTATVVTGSLINFCDVFMSGGTSRSDHSEVGSGVIHFNFDPRGDKYSSLVGDVRGVLLRSAPVFVGGQAGIVGPVHIGFGSVVAAGSLVRRDVVPGVVHFENFDNQQVENFDREIYTGLKRKFLATAKLIGNLHALDAWYEQVRLPFADSHDKPLYQAARRQIQAHIAERIQRLEKIIAKLERSMEKSTALGDPLLARCHSEHRLLIESRLRIREILRAPAGAEGVPGTFRRQYEETRASAAHLDALRQVDEQAAAAAADWLERTARFYPAALEGVFSNPGQPAQPTLGAQV
jgi:UDP-N-acetylglucosamine/UDP-N-acetylgalactosamine diphosphorylase